MKKRSEIKEKMFEFYKVFDNSITDTKSEGCRTERCDPLHKLAFASESSLSKLCADEYGAGSFVALEIAKNLEGLPLSYWVIKVKSRKRCRSKEVFLDDQQLRYFRQTYYLIPTDDGEALTLDDGRPYWNSSLPNITNLSADAWQRGAEASLVANTHLKLLTDPEIKKKAISKAKTIKSRGAQRTAEATKAETLLREGVSRDDIKNQLLSEFGESTWSNFSAPRREEAAFNAIKAADKRLQRERKRKRSTRKKIVG